MNSRTSSYLKFHRLSGVKYLYKQLMKPCSTDSSIQDLFKGLCRRNRTSLARAITLVETNHPNKRKLAQGLVSVVSADLQREQDRRNGTPLSFRIGKHHFTFMLSYFLCLNLCIFIISGNRSLEAPVSIWHCGLGNSQQP